jgi:hypothetical protein
MATLSRGSLKQSCSPIDFAKYARPCACFFDQLIGVKSQMSLLDRCRTRNARRPGQSTGRDWSGANFMKFIVLASLLLSTSALACSFDTDCRPGSQCLKTSGSIYGVCAGGLSPGNSNDREPVYSPLDTNRTYGNTCSFDTDCGPGGHCVKGSSSINGVCMR